jgi:uncharacterized membrane protein
METVKALFDLVGSLICHQLPSRTLKAGNILLPVCSRDTGIYIGVFVSLLFLLICKRMRAQKTPSIAVTIIMCVLMLPMVLDGILSYSGLTQTTNVIRLFTGVMFGIPIPLFLVPAANFDVKGQNELPSVRNFRETVMIYGAAIIVCILFIYEAVPYLIASIIILTGFLSLIFRLLYTINAQAFHLRRAWLYVASSAGTFCMLLSLYVLSNYVLQPLRNALTGG